MSDLPIKATFKSGAGYDAPWLTVDAADPNDLTFKLDALLGGEALAKVVEVASLFQAANNVGPLTQPEVAVPAQQQGGWSNSPAQAQPQWSKPQQQQGGGGVRPGDQPHPEGKTCEICPNVLVFKRTATGKPKWQCPSWRWNNGNPNGHSSEFQN